MTSKLWSWFGVVSAGLAAVFGFVPRSYQGVNCGSLFVESRDAWTEDLANAMLADRGLMHGAMDHAQHCVDVRGGFLPFVLIFAALAVAMFIAAAVSSKSNSESGTGSGEWAKRLDEPEDSL